MTPAFAATPRPTRRLGVVYLPNGMMQSQWNPIGEGTAFKFAPIMEPLAPYRDYLLILSGLANRQADSQNDGSGDHARASSAFLSGVHPKRTEGAVEAAVSMDQLLARELGNQTQLASLEVGLDPSDLAGSCDIGWSCAYTNTISWRSPTTPLPMDNDPRRIFERLFGGTDSTDAPARVARLRENRSILDVVTRKVDRLQRELGPGDSTKLGEYLEAVRDVERRIQKAEEQSMRELSVVNQPAGVPDTFEEHAKLMYDLLTLAYQTDMTRVFTFMIGTELSSRSYPQIGVTEGHHPISHHGGEPEKLAKLAKINAHHSGLFAYFLEKLRSTPDGDGCLLDHVMILYGGGIGNSDRHYHYDLPILLAGGGAGQIRGGRHLRYPGDTPVQNLHLTLMNKMGVPVERIGDSTGQFNELSAL
jgi:hypothetical protein